MEISEFVRDNENPGIDFKAMPGLEYHIRPQGFVAKPQPSEQYQVVRMAARMKLEKGYGALSGGNRQIRST